MMPPEQGIEFLRDAQYKLKLKQGEFAEALRINRSYLSCLMHGKRPITEELVLRVNMLLRRVEKQKQADRQKDDAVNARLEKLEQAVLQIQTTLLSLVGKQQ